MRGRNKLELNHATMMEALGEYLNNAMRHGREITVTDVSEGVSNEGIRVFTVVVEEVKAEES